MSILSKIGKVKLPIMLCAAFLGATLAFSLPVAAAGSCDRSLPEAVREANGCNKNNKDGIPIIITNILTAIIAVSGVVAAVFVLIGGINYMTSAGDAGKVEKAKKTILYALIGMIISVLSFAIVNFTIGAIERGASGGDDTSEEDAE